MDESNRLFYINSNWLSYEEAHNLGYTLSPSESVDLYTADCIRVTVRKDVDENTFYDEANHIWVSSIADIPLYRKLNEVVLYKGNSSSIYESYSDNIDSYIATHVSIDNHITSVEELYFTEGITDHSCINYYIKNGTLICWYDNINKLFWDDIQKLWLTDAPNYDTSSKYFQSFLTDIQFFDDCNTLCEHIDTPQSVDYSGNLSDIENYYFIEPILSYRDYTYSKSYAIGNHSGYTTEETHYEYGYIIESVLFNIVFPGNLKTISVKSNELFGDDEYHPEEEFNTIVEQAQLVEQA